MADQARGGRSAPAVPQRVPLFDDAYGGGNGGA
jgi:hypothetical protein